MTTGLLEAKPQTPAEQMDAVCEAHRKLEHELEDAIRGVYSLADAVIANELQGERLHREHGITAPASALVLLDNMAFHIRDTARGLLESYRSHRAARTSELQALMERQRRLALARHEAERKNKELGFEQWTVPEDVLRTGWLPHPADDENVGSR